MPAGKKAVDAIVTCYSRSVTTLNRSTRVRTGRRALKLECEGSNVGIRNIRCSQINFEIRMVLRLSTRFFSPPKNTTPESLICLDDLVRRNYGEVELHLHHDNDTEESLERTIRSALETYGGRGHFARSADGQMRYGFIHGNWALANGRPDGRLCGVDAELPLLFRTGCYADFTFPSCPDVTQPNMVNQIYWPMGDLFRKRSYESGRQARVGESFDDRLLFITGPLIIGFRWQQAYNRAWSMGRLQSTIP